MTLTALTASLSGVLVLRQGDESTQGHLQPLSRRRNRPSRSDAAGHAARLRQVHGHSQWTLIFRTKFNFSTKEKFCKRKAPYTYSISFTLA